MDETVILTKLTRSAILFDLGGQACTMEGEAYLRGHGSPDFVAYLSSLSEIGPPKKQMQLSEGELEGLKAGLVNAMAQRKMPLVFES